MKQVLVSNIMMLNERERFNKAICDLGYEPIWPKVEQFLSEPECLALVGDVDGWLAGDDRITRAVLEKGLPRLKVISKWGTGIDSIDLDAAKDLGIPVHNAPGAFAHAVAEYAIGLMLMINRQMGEVDRGIRNGKWLKPRGVELHGATLGLVGYGAIGRRIGEIASAGFGMKVLFSDPQFQGSLPLKEVTNQADIMCIACALTPATTQLIDESIIASMKPGAFLINVARGPVVDETALLKALQSRHLAGAGLDVFEQEPLDTSHPFVKMDNVILSSHNANNSVKAVETVHKVTLDNLARVLQ